MFPQKANTTTSLILTTFISYLFFLCIVDAQHTHKNYMRGPLADLKTPTMEEYGSGSNILIDVYQKWISPVKGGNLCPMYPSCSQYSKILFETKPVYEAYIETLERIMRCGHELDLYPEIIDGDRIRWYDPPVRNSEKNNLGTIRNVSEIQLKIDTENSKYLQDSSQDSFADYLFHEKEYYRAATEYMRLRFYSSDSVKRIYYLGKIGLCYFYGKDYESYITYFNENRKYFKTVDSISTLMDLLLGKSYYHLKKFQEAISTIEWSNIRLSDNFFDEAQFTKGVAAAHLFKWEESIKHFSEINSRSKRGIVSSHIIDTLRSGSTLSSREPWFAGTLSAIIPGSGYIYVGRPQTGLASFIVNGLLIWSVYDAAKQKSYGLTAVLGFFGAGWYVGNIIGSVNAADNYNINTRNNFVNKLFEHIDVDNF